MSDPTTRFSDRVDDYTRYRPGYPRALLEYLRARYGLCDESRVADVGAGTGIFTESLLGLGVRVSAVEPNAAMRAESDRRLGALERYAGRAGSAEATTLDDGSVDLVTAAQALHWFDLARAKVEFARILAPGGGIALVWNRRDDTGSAFLAAYESLLRTSIPEYRQVDHRRLDDDDMVAFLGADHERREFDNAQTFDLDGLRGRLMSSSYCPTPDRPGFEPLMERLGALFDAFSENGRVTFTYRTQVYAGAPGGGGGTSCR